MSHHTGNQLQICDLKYLFIISVYLQAYGDNTCILIYLNWSFWVKPEYPQMTLSRRIDVVEINNLWLFRYLQLAKRRTKVVSFHRLSGTGMTSLIL